MLMNFLNLLVVSKNQLVGTMADIERDLSWVLPDND